LKSKKDIVVTKRVPLDELDFSFTWISGILLVPLMVFLFAIWMYTLFFDKIENNGLFICTMIAAIFIVVELMSLFTERHLKEIKTNLPNNKNQEIINLICLQNNWDVEITKNELNIIDLKFYFLASNKLILIADENRILFNIRNGEGHRLRIPYFFGLKYLRMYFIKKKINKIMHQLKFG
jgi:hypothetical protein